MATTSTTTYLAQAVNRVASGSSNGPNPTRLLDSNIVSGTVEFAIIPYTVPSASLPALNDIVNLCVLPADCIPIPALSKAYTTVSPGATLTVKIGSSEVANGYCEGLVLGGLVGDIGFSKNGVSTQGAWTAATDLKPDVTNAANINNGTTIIMTVTTGAATLTANSVIYFMLAYKRGK